GRPRVTHENTRVRLESLTYAPPARIQSERTLPSVLSTRRRYDPMMRLTCLAALAALALLAGPARAELPRLIPRKALFGNPVKAAPRISPDGKRLSFLAPDDNDVLQVWVQTIGKDDARQVTSDKK